MRVVNLRSSSFDVYIGRAGHGQSGEWGNPFTIGKDGSRVEVIAKYKTWLWQRIKNEPELRAKLRALDGKTLGCFCKPAPCHGDVIVDAVAYLKSEAGNARFPAN